MNIKIPLFQADKKKSNQQAQDNHSESVQGSAVALQMLVDHLPQFVFWKDRNCVYQGCNKEFARVAGLSSPEEIVGKTDFDLAWTEEESKHYRRQDKRIMETRIPDYHAIDSQLQADGKRAWLDTSKIPLRSEDGTVVGILGMFEDITDRINAQIELERSRDKLSALVDNRTDALAKTNTELLEANEKLRQASKAKSSFLANMSHEIRTPLNSIIAITELILGTELTEEQTEYVNTLTVSTHALLDLLNNILDYSKIEAGALTLEEIPFSIGEIVKNVVDVLKIHARAKNIDLVYQSDVRITSKVIGDPIRLRQILLNLCANAVKFTEKGKVTIDVRLGDVITEVSTESKKMVLQFSVSDTGSGIGKEKLQSIFDNFSQAELSTSRKFGGTGLGLSISKHLVAFMGGELRVESELGKGSRFAFDLFLKAEPEMAATQETGGQKKVPEIKCSKNAKERADAKGTSLVEKNKYRILVAEDHPVNQRLTQRLVQKAGYQVDVVENGCLALDAVKTGEYNLVLMDVQMPEMDGFAATEAIRAFEAENNLTQMPIIALTAHAMKGYREKCLEHGMSDYLTKPIIKPTLYETIERWLEALEDQRTEQA